MSTPAGEATAPAEDVALTLSCADQGRIVDAAARFFAEHGSHILARARRRLAPRPPRPAPRVEHGRRPMRGGTTVALVLLLAACGGSTGPTANPNARPPAAASAAPPAPSFTPKSLPPSSPSASAEGEAPDDGRIVVTGYTGFSSPSGNIECGVAPEDGYVRCDVLEREWEPPPPPEDCELDYGFGLEVDDSGARLVCADDAVGAPELVLEYGEKLQGGPVLCESEQSGMTCTHQETGEGFTLARADYELF